MIEGLNPSEYFSAEQVRFLQNEAADWIRKANENIIEAANNGRNECIVDIRTTSGIGFKYYNAPDALRAHFEKRGFVIETGGMSNITIKW